MELKSKSLFVNATLNGTSELEFLIDTGAELTVMPQAIAKKHNIRLTNITRRAYSAGGEVIQLHKSVPVDLTIGALEVTCCLWVGKNICEPLLGMDVLLTFNATLDFNEGEVSFRLRRLQLSDLADHPIWAKTKLDCGNLVMEPVKLTGKQPPSTKQYPINRAAIK